ncbi:MAG: hypothetical protein ACK4NR_06185 [Micavibrio sp.]
MTSGSVSDDNVKTIEASRELQKKIGTGVVDEKKVAMAQAVIANNKVDFAPIAKPHLDLLGQAIRESAGLKNPPNEKEILESYMTPIMNIKANAATFNYSLISGLAGTVLMFLETVGKYDRKVVQIVDLLYKTILLVLARKMAGDGGYEGKALITAFQEVCQKTLAKIGK